MGPLLTPSLLLAATFTFWAGVPLVIASEENSNACARISASFISGDSVVAAELAKECLDSVPLHATEASALVNSIRPYMQWHSTLQTLKNPGPGYTRPRLDILAELDKISSDITTGKFESELSFQDALGSLFNSAHDRHLQFIPDLIPKAFEFQRQVALVSISDDGISIPSLYVFLDVLQNSTDSSITISPVTGINNQSASDYLQGFGNTSSLTDLDAAYNELLLSRPQRALGANGVGTGVFAGGGSGARIYPGPSTLLTFKNGTTAEFQNSAALVGNFTGILSGEDFYQAFCAVNPSKVQMVQNTLNTTTVQTEDTSEAPAASPTTIGYPLPVIKHSQDLVGGYYLEGFPDVAVLSVLSFGFQFDVEAQREFQRIIETFFKQSKADGKTRLLIDLRANNGGRRLLGYELFKQLFPSTDPLGTSRLRAHSAEFVIGEVFSNVSENFNLSSGADDGNIMASDIFNFVNDRDVNGKKFSSWNAKFGPRAVGNDQFTSVIRDDLADPLTTVNPINGIGFPITGYLNQTNFSQPFAAQNIIMIQDGSCSSTCALFSELMKSQAGVKSIVLGGRPQNAVMQAVGGTKGTGNFLFSYIFNITRLAITNSPRPLSEAELSSLEGMTNLPDLRSGIENTAGVNSRDNIRVGYGDETPLQFIYEPADCRIFYTAKMVLDVTEVWSTVARVAWGGITSSTTLCVGRPY